MVRFAQNRSRVRRCTRSQFYRTYQDRNTRLPGAGDAVDVSDHATRRALCLQRRREKPVGPNLDLSKMVHFWSPFGANFGPNMSPKSAQKTTQKVIKFGSIFRYTFLNLWSSLGASWEPSWAFQGCLGWPWHPKNQEKLKGFCGFCKCRFLGL